MGKNMSYVSRTRVYRTNLRDSLVDLQEHGLELHTYGEIADPNMRYFNPSIAFHGEELRIVVRSCNFAVKRHGEWYLRDGSAYSKTDVLYGHLDPETLDVSGLTKLKLSKNTPIVTQLAGLEDVRLFSRKDGMYAVGFESDRISRYLHNKSTSLAEYLVTDDKLTYVRTLKKPDPEVVEKNWSPTDVPSKEFEYAYSPTQAWKEDKLIGVPYKGIIHGGSQLVKQKDGTYLSLVHDKVIDQILNRPGVYDKYIYRHYLARHDKTGIITHLSKPFTFGTHENIEFAGGMVEYEDDLIISLGIRDAKYAIARIDKQTLVSMLEPFVA